MKRYIIPNGHVIVSNNDDLPVYFILEGNCLQCDTKDMGSFAVEAIDGKLLIVFHNNNYLLATDVIYSTPEDGSSFITIYDESSYSTNALVTKLLAHLKEVQAVEIRAIDKAEDFFTAEENLCRRF